MSRESDPPLTARQLEILELMSKGLSNPDIARLLGLSQNTVKTHISNLLQTLGVSNRTEASVWFEDYRHQQQAHIQPLPVFVADNCPPELLSCLMCFEFLSLCPSAQPPTSGFYLDCPGDSGRLMQIQQSTSSLIHSFARAEVDSSQSRQRLAAQLFDKLLGIRVRQPTASHEDAIQTLLQIEYRLRSREAGTLREALETLSPMLSAFPDWSLPKSFYVLVAYAAWQEGAVSQLPPAANLINHAQQALHLAPQSAYAQLAFAAAALLMGQLPVALAHTERAINANPMLESGLFFRAQVLALCGLYPQALAAYEQYELLYPQGQSTGRLLVGRAVTHFLAGQLDEAKSHILQAIPYRHSVQAGLCMMLVSIAEQQEDAAGLTLAREQLAQQLSDPAMLPRLMALLQRVLPPTSFQQFRQSLLRAGVSLPEPLPEQA